MKQIDALRISLARLFNKSMGRKITSHLYSKSTSTNILGEFSGKHKYFASGRSHAWVEATPTGNGQYKLQIIKWNTHNAPQASGHSKITKSDIYNPQGGKIFAKADVASAIAYTEKCLLKHGYVRLTGKLQPFGRLTYTNRAQPNL